MRACALARVQVLRGYNGTIFAYGQTSSGKTHTMEGPSLRHPELQVRPRRCRQRLLLTPVGFLVLQGVIPRMVTTLFEGVQNASAAVEFTIKLSAIEIYMEKIRDLLDTSNSQHDSLRVVEDKDRGIFVQNATEKFVTEPGHIFEQLDLAKRSRQVGATDMNADSSRSHCIVVLQVEQRNLEDLSVRTGKLFLVDLAGRCGHSRLSLAAATDCVHLAPPPPASCNSEKVGKTGASGQRLEEAKTINKSLSTLGMVITALTDGASTHVPYRDSKLTRVLQES